MARKGLCLWKLFPAEYTSWCSMRQRCLSPKNAAFWNYGARGIKIHPSWNSFGQFLKDMGPRPTPAHSLDRIDVGIEGREWHYCKENCRWATAKQQIHNRGISKKITWKGEARSIEEWSERTGLPYRTLYARFFRYGWSAEKTLTTPIMAEERADLHPWASGTQYSTVAPERKGMVLRFAGLALTLGDWGERLELDPETIRKRLTAGMTPYEALLKPAWKQSSKSKLTQRGEKRSQKGHLISHAGETLTLLEWARLYGLARNVLYNRLVVYGWPIEKALTAPVAQDKRPLWATGMSMVGKQRVWLIAMGEEEKTVQEWAAQFGLPYSTLLARLQKGWPLEQALNEPVLDTKEKNRLGDLVVGEVRGKAGNAAQLIAFNGKTQTLKAWSAELGVTPEAIRGRIKQGWPLEKVFAPVAMASGTRKR